MYHQIFYQETKRKVSVNRQPSTADNAFPISTHGSLLAWRGTQILSPPKKESTSYILSQQMHHTSLTPTQHSSQSYMALSTSNTDIPNSSNRKHVTDSLQGPQASPPTNQIIRVPNTSRSANSDWTNHPWTHYQWIPIEPTEAGIRHQTRTENTIDQGPPGLASAISRSGGHHQLV